jgi:hypothetical protein
MKNIGKNKYAHNGQQKNEDKLNLPGYPIYPETEDIYILGTEEIEIDPEDITKLKVNETIGKNNIKDFEEVLTGDDLDIPGVELDDVLEEIGSEDEENNYYSLGGENHENLEENLGVL